MKNKIAGLMIIVFLTILASGCMNRTTKDTEASIEPVKLQKFVVLVTDKESKTPIRDAKVQLFGDDTTYITDEMGKTPEIQIQLNKGYFNKYIKNYGEKVGSGFVNLMISKEGYGKHMELDASIFPGISSSVVKIELIKGSRSAYRINPPDISYIEGLLNLYENYEGERINSESPIKYRVLVSNENGRPIENVKVVIPEGRASKSTNYKGIAEFDIAYDESEYESYPVKKEYEEITILLYKKDYVKKAVFKARLNRDRNSNYIDVQLKKDNAKSMDYTLVAPSEKWIWNIFDTYK